MSVATISQTWNSSRALSSHTFLGILAPTRDHTEMWKRLNHRDRQSSIGSPTLIGTDVDEKILQNATNISNGDYSLSSRPAFGRKGTGDVLKGLPSLPLFVYNSQRSLCSLAHRHMATDRSLAARYKSLPALKIDPYPKSQRLHLYIRNPPPKWTITRRQYPTHLPDPHPYTRKTFLRPTHQGREVRTP